MKRAIIALLPAVLAVGLLTCCQCSPSRQPVYHFGTEYHFGSYSVRVDHDADKEEFIFNYYLKDFKYDYSFSFGFTDEEEFEYYRNSTEFKYSDGNGNEMVFDENGYYYFRKDITIYVSYKNANDKFKSAIANGKFSISNGSKTFEVFNGGNSAEPEQ